MAYLELKEVVHRDLAARNVLIDEDNTAKVRRILGCLCRETVYVCSGCFYGSDYKRCMTWWMALVSLCLYSSNFWPLLVVVLAGNFNVEG